MRIIKTILKFVLAAAFIFAGISHFTNEPFFMKIMPDYIPQSLHRPAVIVSGIAEIVLGAMLLVPRTLRLAAWGLISLLIAVFPANIHVYMHQEIMADVSPTAHFWRLPFQGVLIAWAFWYTRPDKPQPAASEPAT